MTEKIDFNEDWTFKNQQDRKCIKVDLPHDAMILEKRSPDAATGAAGAFYPGGIYEYEKTFIVPNEWRNKILTLEMEGVYRKATLFLNGNFVGKIVNGYFEADFELNEYILWGQKNQLKVIADNSETPNSRWYSGAGIYRPVWLYVQEKERFELHSVQITTKVIMEEQSASAELNIRLQTHGGEKVKIEILDMQENVVTEREYSCENTETISKKLVLQNIKLWSDETPDLYSCRLSLYKENEIVDVAEEKFGIREITWNNKGLQINGKEVLLRGGCVHHDNGILGARCYETSEARKVRLLKENGFNAIRSAHNPCSRAMLEACDKYGMYLIDETWDMWYQHKNKYDYAADWEKYYRQDIATIIRKDFNHPSVIMYSIGNEISEPATEKGLALEKEIVDLCHKLDASRPVTGGFNLMILANAAKGQQMYGGDENKQSNPEKKKNIEHMDSTKFNQMAQKVGVGMNHAADSEEADAATAPSLDILDIAGYNYASGRYPMEGEKHPDRILYGSETFPQDIYKNWSMVKKYPYLIGDFMWTAIDYLGEAGIGAWTYEENAKTFQKPYPWKLGCAGVIDILGNPDGEALYARAVWGLNHGRAGVAVCPPDHPEEEIIKSVWRGTNAIPSWSFCGCEGNIAKVEVYSQEYKVELFVNGKRRAEEKLKDCKAVIDIPYEPGTIQVFCYDESGNKKEEAELHSAEGKIRIHAVPEITSEYHGAGVVYLPVMLCGENDVVECCKDTTLSIEVQNGELLGFGSADPTDEEPFWTSQCKTYYGRALAVIKVPREKNAIVKFKGDGLEIIKVHIPGAEERRSLK